MVANSSYHLLIADDDPGFRETLCAVFEPHFDLFEADSGERAIEIVEQQAVDLVLLDMNMHVLTGLETLRILRSMNTLAPCILITADADEALEHDAEEADAYSVLKKPVRRSDLITTVSFAMVETYDDQNFVRELRA